MRSPLPHPELRRRLVVDRVLQLVTHVMVLALLGLGGAWGFRGLLIDVVDVGAWCVTASMVVLLAVGLVGFVNQVRELVSLWRS